jgi:hypothetical protein
MKQIVDFKIHNFPQVPEKKVKVKIGKLDLSKDKEVRLFK